MDRDINASKNILLLLQFEKQGKRRPKCFREKE
jgi:transposase